MVNINPLQGDNRFSGASDYQKKIRCEARERSLGSLEIFCPAPNCDQFDESRTSRRILLFQSPRRNSAKEIAGRACDIFGF